MGQPRRVLIAGGGIGGLASALGCARAGFEAQVFERTAVLSEAGAGVQLGPNATRVLHQWGMRTALAEVAARPQRLVVHNARDGRELGTLELGDRMAQRYRAPYLTIHRADLQRTLLAAVEATGSIGLQTSSSVESLLESGSAVCARLGDGSDAAGEFAVGADGLWSRLREQLLGDGPPRPTGHLAYRTLLRQSMLPEPLRSGDVSVWLGRRLHLVAYPVRAGEWLNVVAIVHATQQPSADAQAGSWDQATPAHELRAALAGCCTALLDLVQAAAEWRLWTLFDRPPMRGAQDHGRGRIVLIGDAAHPMRPYLAQGAGMAIEDAAGLEQTLRSAQPGDLPTRLARFAAARWQRNARVQRRAARNGRIFHLGAPLAWGRDASIRLLGARLLDVRWLYEAEIVLKDPRCP